MLIVNKTLSEVGFICDDYNGFTDDKEEEVAKVPGVYFRIISTLKFNRLKLIVQILV